MDGNCSFIGEGAICTTFMLPDKIPSHSSLTAHPPPQTRSDGRGEASYGTGGRLRLPSLSHHFGAAPALRSFRLPPSSVAPLAPLRSPQPTGVRSACL